MQQTSMHKAVTGCIKAKKLLSLIEGNQNIVMNKEFLQSVGFQIGSDSDAISQFCVRAYFYVSLASMPILCAGLFLCEF